MARDFIVGVVSGEGHLGPSPVWWSMGFVLIKFLKYDVQICTFWCVLTVIIIIIFIKSLVLADDYRQYIRGERNTHNVLCGLVQIF